MLMYALLSAALPLPTAAGAAAAASMVQVLPAGQFAARDGRPGEGKHWTLSNADGQRLADALSAVAARTPIAIDYEHQTLMAADNGQPAPAAGWMQAFEWRADAGLWAKVQWTDRAAALIAAGEYRYLSPVIRADASGAIVDVYNAALVNVPALLGMQSVQAALSALSAQRAQPPHAETRSMPTALTTAAVLAIIGLPATATEAEATATVAALRNGSAAKPKIPDAVLTALGLPPAADEAAALAAVQRLRTAPDATTLAAMTALQTELATVRAENQTRELTELVDKAITVDRKLVPALREWALNMGRGNLQQLKDYIAAAPVIPGLGGQGGDGKPATEGAGGAPALSADQTALATQLGLDPSKYAAHLKAAQPAA